MARTLGSPPPPTTETAEGGFARTAALVIGGLFLIVGVLGFIPGPTIGYDTMQFAGHHTDARLLGLFEVSVLHNIVHLLLGVAGLVLSRTVTTARLYLFGGAAVYLVLWAYGLIIDVNSAANFIPLNRADNVLHLGLAVLMILLGWIGGPGRQERTAEEGER
jgi:hypothetical protein